MMPKLSSVVSMIVALASTEQDPLVCFDFSIDFLKDDFVRNKD